MTRPTFYRLGLLIPYLLPVLALLLWGVLGKLPNSLATILGFAFFSAFVWAIPYLPVVIGLLFWSRGQTAGRIKRVFLLAPMLLAAALVLFSLFFSEAGERLASAAALGGLALLIGYAFAALWLGLEILLTRLGAL